MRFFSFLQRPYEIYTDGSQKKNRGSWAYVIARKGKILREASGLVRKASSNHMEFQAAIEALQSLPQNSRVTVYSDSRILIDAATLWIPEWKARGWLGKKDRPIPRVEQMQALDALCSHHRISWRWIRAHAGIPYNERCDQLCREARSL